MNDKHISCPSHCCIKHGCKYNYRDCPVETGAIKQHGGCEQCGLESEGYYGEREPMDYNLYTSPGVKRALTPSERITALSNAYSEIINDHHDPIDDEIFQMLDTLSTKYSK